MAMQVTDVGRDARVWSSPDLPAGEEAGAVCALPAAPPAALTCPTCARKGTLVVVQDALFCAACGYASDSAAGCT